jgi:hypothetical protein
VALLFMFPVSARAQQAAHVAKRAYSTEVQRARDAARLLGVPQHTLPRRTVAQIRAHKLALAPWQQKIASIVLDRLERLEENGVLEPDRRASAPNYANDHVPIDTNARLLVEFKADNVGPFNAQFFDNIGGQLVSRAFGYGLVVAWVPADHFQALATLENVHHIWDVGPGYTDLGSVTTEGDSVHNADLVRNCYGVDGTGELVGAISDGVDSLAASQALGDLGAVNVLDNSAGGDEGTAMLEIVADLAPGANLAFHTGSPGSATMIDAINDLVAAGATIITDDLPKPREPVFEDGPIAQAKQNAFVNGVFYTASAGNRGNEHHQDNFNGTTTNVNIGPNTFDRPHDFGGGDFQLQATATANNPTIYLQWAEPFGSAGIDLDLYVLDNAGNVLASSTDTQDGDDNPIEVASTGIASGTTFNLLIDVINPGDTTVFFDLRAFRTGGWEYLIKPGSINGASRQVEVYAAGAVPAFAINTVQSSSSRGPIIRFFPTQVTRMKPDGIGLNGVSITGVGGFGSGTCPAVNPGDCLFFGTSASTPHVAGLAALLLEVAPALTPTEVAATLNDTAVDIDVPGPDNNAGFGRLDILAAVDSLSPLFELDIKPGSCPNPFNRRSRGVLPVALVGTGTMCEASDIDIATILISRADGVGGSAAPNEGPPGPHSVVTDVATPFVGNPCECHELEGDGVLDLSMKFRSQNLVGALQLNDLPSGATVELVVSGFLVDGTPFSASDCITIVPPVTVLMQSNLPNTWLDITPLDQDSAAGGFTPLSRTYLETESVTITAPLAPPAYPGWVFHIWLVNAVPVPGFSGTLEMTIDGDVESVIAVYRRRSLLSGPEVPPSSGTER